MDLHLTNAVAATGGNIWWWILGIAAVVGLIWWWSAASSRGRAHATGQPHHDAPAGGDPPAGDGQPGQAEAQQNEQNQG